MKSQEESGYRIWRKRSYVTASRAEARVGGSDSIERRERKEGREQHVREL
jgi:hypothetical protein